VARAFVIACVLGCAAAAHAQSSVLEWPPRPPPDMAQPAPPPPSDMGAPPQDLARPPAAPADLKPAAASPTDGGAIKTIDVPAGKTIDQVALPKGTITSDAKGLGQIITDVRVVDNTRTDSETVRYIAGVKPGEILTQELVTEVRERLLTVGLFKDVNITWEPAVPGGNAGVRLILGAKDKLSWIVAPIFHYSPGDYGGGLA
jgi:hypothetical protein